MIHYSLKCAENHGFDSWFQSGAAFDALQLAGHVTCPVCGSAQVDKSLMAPAVGTAKAAPAPGDLTTPANAMEQAMAAMRRHVSENSEYVGMNFATEARRIHDGDAEARSIFGEARLEEARQLLEDGVPVAPLPFMPSRKTN